MDEEEGTHQGATVGGEPQLSTFRQRVIEDLTPLLESRDASFRARVLGAGSDDFQSGRRFLAVLAPGGYAVPTWPREHGGMGLPRDHADVVAEVLEGFETPDMYPFLVGLDLIGPTVLVHGSEEQKARWLPSMRNGEEIWCQGFSEPDAGSDLANLKMRAEQRSDGWHLTGSKVWTSRAHYAQRCLLLARSDSSVPKHAGITAFGLDLASPGVEIRPLIQMNGDAHFNEVFLDDVVVPDDDRVGGPGAGWRVAVTCLSFERGSLAGDLGVSLEQLRSLGGPGLQDRAATRDRLLRSVVDLRIIQMTGQRARAARRAGKPPGPEDSGAKIRTSRMIKQVAGVALEAKGPAGVVGGVERPGSGGGVGAPGTVGEAGGVEEDPWQTIFLVSPSLSIRGGTDEIQHNILGERVLGLPPEPRMDKGKPFAERPDH